MRAQILDQYHGDPSLTHLYAALEGRPKALEAMKTASFDAAAAESLPSRAFAWEDERRFPLHTREDALASIAYRAKYASAVPAHVDEKLAAAAEAYGITPDMLAPALGVVKVALAFAEVDYALPSHGRLPLGSPAQIKLAEEVLLRDGQRALDLTERTEAFSKVAHAAGAAGLAISDETATYAGLRACNTYVLRDRIGMRAARCKTASDAARYDTLAEGLRAAPGYIYDRPMLLKLAARLEQLDALAGLTPEYGTRLFDPMQTIFNEGATKTAGELLDVAGKQVPVETLMGLPPEMWQQLDAEEVGQVAQQGDVETFKQVFATLPLDIKAVLAGQLP